MQAMPEERIIILARLLARQLQKGRIIDWGEGTICSRALISGYPSYWQRSTGGTRKLPIGGKG